MVWVHAGVFDALHRKILERLAAADEPDRSAAILDAASCEEKRGSPTGRSPVGRGPRHGKPHDRNRDRPASARSASGDMWSEPDVRVREPFPHAHPVSDHFHGTSFRRGTRFPRLVPPSRWLPSVRLPPPGRPRKLSPAQLAMARAALREDQPVGQVTEVFGVSRATLYRYLAQDAEQTRIEMEDKE